jgi:hypothetical protein
MSSYRERPTLRPGVDTMRGLHKCGATRRPFMGKRRRSAHNGSKARTQARVQEMGTTQEKGEATVLTAGQRCRRRGLDGDDGAVWSFAAAPGSLLCFSLPASVRASSSLAASGPAPLDHRRPLVAARRWRHGARLLLSRLHSPLPPRRRSQEKGKTPRGLWLAQEARPWVIGARSKQRREAGARIGGRGSHWRIFLGWRRGRPPVVASSPLASPAGVKGVTPPRRTPWSGSRVRARARRARQLGGPAIPSVCAAAVRRVRCGAVRHGEKGEG